MYHIQRIIKSVCLFVLVFLAVQPVFSQDLSDNDIKKNITPVQKPLEQITALNPAVFEYNTSRYDYLKLPGGTHYGFIAEEFQQVFPGLVYKKRYPYMAGKNAYRNATVRNIDMQALIPVLVAAVREQQEQIEQLRTEIEALKKR